MARRAWEIPKEQTDKSIHLLVGDALTMILPSGKTLEVWVSGNRLLGEPAKEFATIDGQYFIQEE